MRQNESEDGDDVNDLQLADLFGASSSGSTDDEILGKLAQNNQIDRLRLESWETQDELKSKLFEVIADELPQDGIRRRYQRLWRIPWWHP